jgi:hypothetical protein
VQTVLADITTALSAATASVNGGGDFGSVAAAEAALHTAHLDILNVINNDPALATLATQNGATGFLAAPTALPAGTAAADAPHANLAEIGTIFNDLANISLGGINADNSAQATADVNAIVTDMQALITANPLLFGGLTGIHADAVVRQLQLENTYIAQATAGVTPDSGRASNDNLLDIIDIVQGDTNLANMANQGGVHGFTPFGDALNPTPAYQDNDAQTNFWANFIAQSNSLGQQAMAAVGDAAATATVIADLQAFQTTVTNFDAAQGGIFEARFDNELLGDTSTLGAEVAGMIKGLQTGNAALVGAAAEQMHANAADVGGNNLPVTGGTYNADGATVADVLSTATTATATNGAGDGAAAAGGGTGAAGGAGAGAGAGTGGAGAGAGTGTGTGAGTGAASSGDDDAPQTGAGAAAGAGDAAGAGGCHGGHGNAMLNDIAALLQAMQNGNSTAVTNAVTTLSGDMHNASAVDLGHFIHNSHFEHIWH